MFVGTRDILLVGVLEGLGGIVFGPVLVLTCFGAGDDDGDFLMSSGAIRGSPGPES